MSLKAAEIRASQPRKNAYKMADERGLFLLIQPSGARLWRLKYRFRGYGKKLNLGKYPEIGLAEARERRDEARRLIASGIDPAVARKQAELEAAMSQATTFRVVADEYIEKMACEGKAASTLIKMRWFRDVLEPDIGHRPIAEITPHEMLDALRRVERRGHRETARRLRAFADRVFRYAIVTLRATSSPADILRGALTAPKVTQRAAVLEPRKVGALLRAIDGYDGRPETRIALQHRTQDERRNVRRQAILDAAEALFLEHGYPSVRLHTIVQRSGGSLATIYQMFGNKQGLLRAVVDRNTDEDLKDVEALFSSDLPPRRVLQEVALRYHVYSTTPRAIAFMRLVIAESLSDPEFGRTFDRDMRIKYIESLAATFAMWNASGRACIDRPQQAAELYFAMALCNEPMRVLFGAPTEPTSQATISWRLAPFLEYFKVGR